MIVSASRRTDIPAYYSAWLCNRLRAGFCLVPNPFNPRQISRVSLAPEDVDALVFWTRNPSPMLRRMDDIERSGYRSVFLYTVVAHPSPLDGRTPPLAVSLRTFCVLAQRVGPERVVWRYDPIVLTQRTDCDFHLRAFETIARGLQGATQRVIVSFFEPYKKIRRRLDALAPEGFDLLAPESGRLARFLEELPACATGYGMRMQSCAQEMDLTVYGIAAGSCIDAGWLSSVLGRDMGAGKDACQRTHCGCAASKDIGMYDACLTGCAYCYATSSFIRAAKNFRRHDPAGPALLPLD